MGFNQAQFQAIIDKMTGGLTTMQTTTTKLGPKVEHTANQWYVPNPVAQMLIGICNKVIEGINWIVEKILDFLKGVAAPVIMFMDAVTWEGEEIRGKATSVAASTQKFNLKAPKEWKGEGASAYTDAVYTQSGAAGQIGTSADKIAGSLKLCAAAGVTFYAAIGTFLVQLIPALMAASAAAASVVGFAPAGLIVAGEVAVGGVVFWGAVAALGAVITAQWSDRATLTGEASDNTNFPDGKWPVGTA
ncbi:hypothetical protein [Streptomyces sp. SAJ15]|uniref:hypothetical protein n=1 Tax=Streptomyces sp. SAJ15 TaxID=2011095 RepID=UPI001185D306|nr:hypothetical protein [Streptomyces sp. SAJ15]TVL94418.1 hypothetical protein CD790_05520 [Streptomyces sp. SAJ15]